MPIQIRTLSPSTCVDRFIQTDIQADQSFIIAAGNVIDTLVRILHSSSFSYNVAEVLKTGSLGQGTALKNNLSDIDLVVYLNGQTVQSLTSNIKKILTDMDAVLRSRLPNYTWLSQDPFRLGIQLQANGQTFEVDLLPGIAGSLHDMYMKMHSESDSFVRAHYSVTFAKQQKDFIQTRHTKLKTVFQLMKYWSKVDLKDFGVKKFPSYLMTLIVIHTWEEYGSPPYFKTHIGFKAVLNTLAEYQKLHKVWFANYDSQIRRLFEEPFSWMSLIGMGIRGLLGQDIHKPYLIDPANPSSNILDAVWNWDAVARAAKSTLQSPLLINISVTSNWK